MTIAETAHVLELPRGTANTRLRRARALLRALPFPEADETTEGERASE